MKTAALSLAIVLAVSCPVVDAQDYMGPSVDYVGNHLSSVEIRRQLERNQDARGVGKRGERDARRPQKTEPGRGQRASVERPAQAGSVMRALSFSPSAAVSGQVQASMAALLSGREVSNPSSTARVIGNAFARNPRFRELLAAQLGADERDIQSRLRAGTLQSAFRNGLARHGYSATNMADVNNAYMIHAWGLVNDARFDQAQAYAGQRAKLERSIADGMPAPRMSDAEKQDYSELVGLMVVLTGAAWDDAATKADRASLQSGMRAVAQGMGLDLRGVRMTARGFVGI